MNKKDKDRAKQLFEKSNFDTLYMNKNGNFFSTENLAKNSVMKEVNEADRRLEKITRNSLLKDTKLNIVKLLEIDTSDGGKLVFETVKFNEYPAKGAKALKDSKSADGLIEVSPQFSYRFDKGVLTEIIENKR